MRSISLKFLLPAIIMLVTLRVSAQICTGSLGDPVINETFGSAATGTALPFTGTNYKFTNESCPDDGYYTIERGFGGCFSGNWLNIPHDHTGDPDGFMMVVNASFDPGIFYVQKASKDKLCPNTTYEFAAWILNLIHDNSQNSVAIRPNITFSIETLSGVVLKTYSTGDIPQHETQEFHQYGTFFTTPSTDEDILVKMINNAPGGNGNDIILDDITFRPCGPVIEAGFGNVNQTADRDLCQGENGSYTLKAKQTGYSDPKFQWQVNKNDDNGWADITGETTTTLNVVFSDAIAGKYQYRMGVAESANTSVSCRIYSQPLTININPLPVIDLKAQTIACEGQQLRLFAAGGDEYKWTGPNNFSSTEQSVILSEHADNSKDGLYTVTVTTKGCVSVASTTVSVVPVVNPTISSDVSICAGDVTQLTAGGGINYKWTPAEGLDHDDIPNPVAKPGVTTVYNVKIDNGGCFDESKSVTVTVLKRPGVNAGPDFVIQEGETVKLQGTVAGDDITHYWTPDDHIAGAASLTPMVSPIENTTYTLHAESQDCGAVTDDVFIRVYRKVTIPNTFSPNGDGINDLWNIDKLDTYPESLLTVYTRAGREVFKTTGYAKPWNGTFQGQPLPVGVYYYVLDLQNNTPKRSGWVMLVR